MTGCLTWAVRVLIAFSGSLIVMLALLFSEARVSVWDVLLLLTVVASMTFAVVGASPTSRKFRKAAYLSGVALPAVVSGVFIYWGWISVRSAPHIGASATGILLFFSVYAVALVASVLAWILACSAVFRPGLRAGQVLMVVNGYVSLVPFTFFTAAILASAGLSPAAAPALLFFLPPIVAGAASMTMGIWGAFPTSSRRRKAVYVSGAALPPLASLLYMGLIYLSVDWGDAYQVRDAIFLLRLLSAWLLFGLLAALFAAVPVLRPKRA